MFKTYILEDVVALDVPEYFGDANNIAFHKLCNKFVDKVIHGIGLSISPYHNFLKIESKILPNEGRAHFKINFKLLVFSPSVDDVFRASVMVSNRNFIQLTLGFFNDILVMSDSLGQNYKYEDKIKSWSRTEGGVKKLVRIDDELTVKVKDVIYNRNKVEGSSAVPEGNPLPVLMIIATILDQNDHTSRFSFAFQ